MMPITFLDTETTGLHHAREPWEIALIRREDGLDTETVFLLDVDQLDLANAQPQALEIGGFYRRHPLGIALTSSEGYDASGVTSRPQGAAIVQQYTQGAVLVVNNPVFDVPLLERLLLSAGLAWSWHYRPVDVIALAAGHLKGAADYDDGQDTWELIGDSPWRSEDISKTVGVIPPSGEERHTALGDARWVRDMYDAVMAVRS